MRVVVLLTGLVLLTASCTGVSGTQPSSVITTGREPVPTPSPTALPSAGLKVGTRTRTDGWVVMADGFGVDVAGGGTLQNIDPVTGKSSRVARIGSWDYDFTTLGHLGEGSLWLVSGHDLWFIAGSPHYAVGGHYDLRRLGYLGAVYQASPRAGGGLWVAASGNKRQGRLLAEIDPDSGSVIRRLRPPGGAGTITEAGGFIIAQTGHGVIRINPRTGGWRTKRFVVTPGGLATTGDRIWWSSSGGVVSCLLVQSLTHCGSIDIPGASTLSSEGRRLWVLSGNQTPLERPTVTLVDGETGDVLAKPLVLPYRTQASLTSCNGHAWVGFHDAQVVVRLDRDPNDN